MAPALRPFVVIDERPWEIPLHLNAVVHRPAHLGDVLTEVADRFLPALGADAVLRDDDRFVVTAVDINKHMVETSGYDLPAQLGVAGIMLAARTEDEAQRAGLLGVVIVDPDQVAGVGHHVELVAVLMHHQVVNGAGGVQILGLLPVGEGIDAHDERIGALLAHDGGGVTEHVRGDAHRLLVAARMEEKAGRPMSGKPAELQGPVGLVLRNVDADVGLGRLDDTPDVSLPGGPDIGVEEVGLRLVLRIEPVGEGEVPEGEKRLDAGLPALACHLGILTECGLVDLSLARFDARPLHSEAEMIHAEFFQCRQILVEFAPRKHGVIPARRCSTLLGEVVPIGLEIPLGSRGATLVLVLEGGGRCSPPEGFLGERFEGNGTRGRGVLAGWRDASREQQEPRQEGCHEKMSDGCLMHEVLTST